jgi:putative regulator of septum formation
LQVDDELTAEVAELPVIDCTKPHTHEIFATVQNTVDAVYPGMAALEQFAETNCYKQFEPYVGIDWPDSSLFVTWIVPSLGSWNDEDDRAVMCVLGRKDGGQLERTAKDIKL